jgi:hypothetical protein
MFISDEYYKTWKLVPVVYIYLLSKHFQERTELNHRETCRDRWPRAEYLS